MTTSLMDPLLIMPFLWGNLFFYYQSKLIWIASNDFTESQFKVVKKNDSSNDICLSGAVSCSFNWTSASVSEVTVRHGDNITLYCDCKMGDGGMTVWFRNCFNESHPVLVLDREYFFHHLDKTQFIWTKNVSSDSYDLTIINVTFSDEGFYYCGTERKKVEDKEKIDQKTWFNYSNIIRKISITSNRPHNCTSDSQQNDGVCWKLLFSVCPIVSVLSALLSVLVYRICQKSGFLQASAANSSQNSEKIQNSRDRTRPTLQQDEDVCYAALEIRHSSLKPKRKRTTQASDFSTYSAVRTSKL
ncbi:uncharacterized protein LOC105358627 isoform X2 [Oryzias latipes]|uniref:uncharacterized protein LOC105358627 isoform X2 n=1 Tax=Oryzias latipes TaxID=8090 RepID=UPI000CE1CB29|nr:uncharacterized protein LOC105358627 isoform X2 [Oryzias latipes]